MNAPVTGSAAAADLGALPRRPPDGRWWALERMPRWRAGAQTAAGRTALVAVFTLLAQAAGLSWPYVLAAAAFAYLPAWRGAIAVLAAGVGLARGSDAWLRHLAPLVQEAALSPGATKALVLATLAAYLAWAWTVLRWSRQRPTFFLARRPVIGQCVLAALLGFLASLPGWPPVLRLALWLLLSIWGVQMWILAYALRDQRSRAAGPIAVQMGWFHPFWRASAGTLAPTPFGKGAAFLRKHQASNAQELAVTQLKALKLLVWAMVLDVLNKALLEAAARLGIPPTEVVYAAFLAGTPHPTALNWASLVVASVSAALVLAVLGHKIIAVARLAGFRLPRNTWRPLEARTLAEFWNRYYYYFKELLVDFFFFPTFLKMFRHRPRLRVFFATFMAAGVGNAIYHFLRDIHFVASMGWQAATVGYASNLFYCTVLALGIGISQTRLSAGRQLAEGWAARLWSVLCVWGFFVVLRVFGDESRTFAFGDRWAFFLSLFGVSP